MRSMRLALVVLAGLSMAPKSKLDPASYIPADAAMLLHVPDPRGALTRIERLAASAGLAPPGAEPGWIVAQLAAEQPGAGEIDLDRPLWFAARPGPDGRLNPDDPDFVLVAGVKGSAKNILDQVEDERVSARVVDGWLLAGHAQKGQKLAPARKRFRFAKTTGDLREAASVLFRLDFAKFPLEAMADGTASLEQMRMTQQMLGQLTFGLGLADTGIDILMHSAPEPTSPMAKLYAGVSNRKGGLLSGLPPAAYTFLAGGSWTSDYSPALLKMYRPTFLDMLKEQGQGRLIKFYDEMINILSADESKCGQSSLGFAMPSGLESTFMVSTARCKDAGAVQGTWDKMIRFVNRLIEDVEKREKEEFPVRVARTGQTSKVGGVAMRAIGLDFGEDAPPDIPPLMQVPLQVGIVSKSVSVMSWNAPKAFMAKHVAAAKAGRPTPVGGFSVARDHLLEPRLSEGYLNVGSLVVPFLDEEMAPMRFMLNALPPIGLATRGYGDGSSLTQIWLPPQLAQMAASFAQMANGGPPTGPRGPGKNR